MNRASGTIAVSIPIAFRRCCTGGPPNTSLPLFISRKLPGCKAWYCFSPKAASVDSLQSPVFGVPTMHNKKLAFFLHSRRFINLCSFPSRCLSSDSGNDGKDGKDEDEVPYATDENNGARSKSDDPFGVKYDDGDEGLGPSEELPPRLARDPTTGELTGEAERELSDHDREIIGMTPEQKLNQLADRIERAFSQEKKEALSQRILDGTSELGRVLRENHPDAAKWASEDRRRDWMRRKKERAARAAFRKNKGRDMTSEEIEYGDLLRTHGLARDEEDDISGDPTWYDDDPYGAFHGKAQPQNVEQRRTDEYPSNPWAAENLLEAAKDLEDPYSEDVVLPPELTRSTKVNRRMATPIPTNDLHHNNLALLRRYVTPGGQIKNRMQSRLGAKDQRKVAKLIKRARALGLIPHVGQWKVRDDGDIIEAKIGKKREWENVMEKVGVLGKKRRMRQLSDMERDDLIRKGRALGIIKKDSDDLVDELARQLPE